MSRLSKKREEHARIAEQEKYGISLSDIKKKHSDNRIFLCLVRAILQFLAVYGTIVGLAASFELEFSVPVVTIALLLLSVISAFIYYNKITFYVGYIVIFLILIVIAFAFYMYINSGFQAFLNEVISRYETFFNLTSGRVAEEQITDRYLTVSAMLIFVGGIFSIFFNITISGYMDLPMTFIVSFLPLQFAFYIDIIPPRIYLIMLLAVYISVAVLGRSGHYTLPYRYEKDVPFGRKRSKNKVSHFYQSSGQGMLVMLGYSVALSAVIMLIVGSVFNADFSTKKLSNSVKDITDKYVKTVVVSGVTALFNRYDAVGGLSKGQLGGIRSLNPDYQADLVVDYVHDNNNYVYLKAYTGVRYERNRFYNTFNQGQSLQTADDIITADDYAPDAFDNLSFNKIRVQNVGADKTYDYQPYITFYTTSYGSPGKIGVAPNRSLYTAGSDILNRLSIDTALNDNTYESVYLPIMANVDYVGGNYAKAEEISKLYLSYPTELTGTLSAISNEAGLNTEQINALDPKSRTIMIADSLRRFYEDKFTYTYTPGATPYNEDTIEHFLNKNRKGFCAHFASSATLIMRYMGVPARYCEGYLLQKNTSLNNNKISDDTTGWITSATNETSGDYSADGIYEIELSDADAHSWVEIYVDGYGWIPYEMTPPASETETSSNNLGIFKIFAGLFNPTERLIDDTSGDSSNGRDSSGGLVDSLSEALSDASGDSSNGLVQFVRTFGYLLIPFISMIIALIIIIVLWILIKRLILKARIRRLIKNGNYSDALLLEYRAILKKLQKRKIITTENPSVRELEQSIKHRVNINNDDISVLADTVLCAAFSSDDIDEALYYKAHEILITLHKESRTL